MPADEDIPAAASRRAVVDRSEDPTWRVDEHGQITRFTGAQSGEEPTGFIGACLYDSFGSEAIAEIYRLVARRALNSGRELRFVYRCDTPEMLRMERMHVQATADGSEVEYRSELVAETVRSELEARVDARRAAPTNEHGMVVACSWCGCISTPDGWIPAERFTISAMSTTDQQFTHGACDACVDRMLRMATVDGAGPDPADATADDPSSVAWTSFGGRRAARAAPAAERMDSPAQHR